MRQGLLERIAQAGHVGGAGPVPVRQVLVGTERVALQVAGHLRPVDAAHVLAPAEDLAHEALDAGQGCLARVVGRRGRRHHLARIQQLQVQCRRQVGVVKPRIARPHRILVTAKQRQALLHEGLQCLQRVRTRHRPREAVEAARMLRKALGHERDHLARQRIGLEAAARRHCARAGSTKGLAVLGIEIPLSAERQVLVLRVHQHAMPLALLAVEVLHAQRLAAAGMCRELAHADEEVAVLADLQRHGAGLGHGLEDLQHAPVAWCRHDQPGRPQPLDVAAQLLGQTAAIVRCVEPRVVQRAAGRLQRQREVPHRRQEHHGAGPARPYVRRLVDHLGHPDRVELALEAIEGGSLEVELVAQHQHQ